MNQIPLVSICIPTYNGEEFITEALESVLAQTYPYIEVILSDDDSTDNTVQIVSSLQKRFSNNNFLLFQHERYGIARNWNFCIAQSQGKYIKFLFQDDLLEPECIAEMVSLAEEDEEIGLVFCPRELILTKEAEQNPGCMDVYRYAKDVHKAWSELRSVNVGYELLAHSIFFKHPLNKIGEPSNVLLRKQVFDKVGLFDSDLYQTLDMDMWFRIMCKYKIGFVDQFLVKFRIHPKQASYTNLGLINALDNHILRAKMLYSPSYFIANQQIQQQFAKEVRNLMKAELEQLFAIIQQMPIENEQLQQQLDQAESQLNHSQEHFGPLRVQQLISRKRDLQNNIQYGFLVCDAWYSYQNGDLSRMAKYLQKSLSYTPFSLTETLLNWLETFTTFSEEKGLRFDTYALSNSNEWKQVISYLISTGENIHLSSATSH
ncbi:glycosyltransferase family 2 protein [Microcoleus sp. S36b_A3]|uniref:glycosyltransferase family 2 protein n=1 Tax=unclassified Microcoleus TaxID=2642155 RepID=UPI002FD1FA33